MRHPLRRIATQGGWYAIGSGLAKLSGFILLPVLTNTRFLSVADYGRWGIYEVTAQIAINVLGLFLPLGLVRFFPEKEHGPRALSAAWWITVALALGTGIVAGGMILLLGPEGRTVYELLLAFVLLELMLAIPMALLRAQERAGWYTGCSAFKLSLLLVLALWLLTGKGLGLKGFLAACALSSAATLLVSLLIAHRREFVWPRVDLATARPLMSFSVPLVIGGLGSMVLNAGDRYILAMFRTPEELAVYTLAARFGGVVNMLVVQPFNLAWLPLLFRLEAGQRPEVLKLLVPYLTLALSGIVVGLCMFAGPLLLALGSAAPYRSAVPLLPLLGFGFWAFGLSVVFSGVLALHRRTRFLAFWLIAAALLNLGLNFLLVPVLGAWGAALNTLLAYLFLLIGQYRAARREIPIHIPWIRLAGITAVSFAFTWIGVWLPVRGTWWDWSLRLGLLVIWAAVLLLARWLTLSEIREVYRVLRGGRDLESRNLI